MEVERQTVGEWCSRGGVARQIGRYTGVPSCIVIASLVWSMSPGHFYHRDTKKALQQGSEITVERKGVNVYEEKWPTRQIHKHPSVHIGVWGGVCGAAGQLRTSHTPESKICIITLPLPHLYFSPIHLFSLYTRHK